MNRRPLCRKIVTTPAVLPPRIFSVTLHFHSPRSVISGASSTNPFRKTRRTSMSNISRSFIRCRACGPKTTFSVTSASSRIRFCATAAVNLMAVTVLFLSSDIPIIVIVPVIQCQGPISSRVYYSPMTLRPLSFGSFWPSRTLLDRVEPLVFASPHSRPRYRRTPGVSTGSPCARQARYSSRSRYSGDPYGSISARIPERQARRRRSSEPRVCHSRRYAG